MHTPQRKILTSLNLLLDTAIALFSWQISYYIRDLIESCGFVDLKGLSFRHQWYDLVIGSIILFPILLRLNKIYPTNRLRPFTKTVFEALKSVLELIIILIIFSFFFAQFHYNRSLILLYGFALLGLFCLKEYLIKKLYLRYGNIKSTLVIGRYSDVEHILERLKKEDLALRIQGVIYLAHGHSENRHDKHNVNVFAYGLDNISEILETNSIELVIIGSYKDHEKEVENVLFACGERGIEAWIKLELFGIRSARLDSGQLGDSHMIIFSTTPPYDWAIFIKTSFDFLFAILFFPLFCFLYVLIGAGIKISSPGPVLFIQKRGGLYGKPFLFYKFRTMYKDAEQRREELKKCNIMAGPVFKILNDPRVFPFGKFLRKTSLDEIPQILNVLKGEMSLVGPRPLPMIEVSQIKGWQRRRFSMKPGLTCLWQIGGRNKICDFEKWAKLDLEYIDNWSLALDLAIFFKTIWVVLTERGAA